MICLLPHRKLHSEVYGRGLNKISKDTQSYKRKRGIILYLCAKNRLTSSMRRSVLKDITHSFLDFSDGTVVWFRGLRSHKLLCGSRLHHNAPGRLRTPPHSHGAGQGCPLMM